MGGIWADRQCIPFGQVLRSVDENLTNTWHGLRLRPDETGSWWLLALRWPERLLTAGP
jgi:hypothetical protein